MTKLGIYYKKGKIVKQDYSKAIEYFEKAAKLEDPFAMTNLGIVYENELGVEEDYSIAVEYYSRASCLGDSFGMFHQGKELDKTTLRQLNTIKN